MKDHQLLSRADSQSFFSFSVLQCYMVKSPGGAQLEFVHIVWIIEPFYLLAVVVIIMV